MLNNVTTIPPKNTNKERLKTITQSNVEKIISYQKIFSAQEKYSLLVILQGLDASGKDGAVRSVFSGINPSGIEVHSFKKPTPLEFAHDYLWRVHAQVPRKGMIKIFNRSHYEDILVPSVEGYIDSKRLAQRYAQINDFEKLLSQNNTRIVKFYLHNSSENQLKRLNERLERKEKYFKHNDGDWEVREKRVAYQKVYEKIFKKCAEPKWHIIPSDKNWYKSYLISKVILSEFKKMKLEWPELDTERFA